MHFSWKSSLFLLLWFYAWNKYETADSDAITDWQPLLPRASIMCLQLYENFVEEVDAVDNGISQCDGEARYSISTTLSARVSHLNPRWNSTDQDTEVSTCECSCTLYQDRRWLLTCVTSHLLYGINYSYYYLFIVAWISTAKLTVSQPNAVKWANIRL